MSEVKYDQQYNHALRSDVSAELQQSFNSHLTPLFYYILLTTFPIVVYVCFKFTQTKERKLKMDFFYFIY